MLVNISKAAALVGLSRTQLYRGYVNTGKISTVTVTGKPAQIDTSELIRVFGELQQVTPQICNGTPDPLQPVTVEKPATVTATLQAKVDQLNELLQIERENRYRMEQEKDARIADLHRTINLLEHYQQPTAPPEPKKSWWQRMTQGVND